MRAAQLVTSTLFLAFLSAAGPLRRDGEKRQTAPSSNTTQALQNLSSSTIPDILTIIPDNPPDSATTVTLTDLPSSLVSSTSSSSSTSPASVSFTTTASNSSSAAFNATGSSSPTTTGPAGGPTIPSNTLSSMLNSTVNSVSRFTLNNTLSIIPPTTAANQPTSSAASAGYQSASQTTVISIAISSLASITPMPSPSAENATTTLSSSSTSTSTPSSFPQSSITSPIPIPTITQIPTTLPPSVATGTSISPAQFSSNVAEAQGYNNLFATLNFSSPCTSGDIACISGNVGNCNSAGNFVITDVCSAGTKCFAMPMNNTEGVVVQCTDKGEAAEVLGSSAISPASTDGQTITIGSLTLGTATTSPPACTSSPSSQVSNPEATISPIPATSETINSIQAPTTSNLIPQLASSAGTPPSSQSPLRTTTMTIQPGATATSYVTVTIPTSQVTLAPQSPGSATSGVDGVTIVPISNGAKETVFVTIIETFKETATVTLTTTAA